jgi:hypothetical protein
MSATEKDHFTLDEILRRWRYAGIDEATLLKLATDDLLVFSVYIRDLGSYTSTMQTGDTQVTTNTSVAFSFRDPKRSRPPLQYLRADDARRLLESLPNEKIRVSGHYSLPSRTEESGLGYLTDGPLFAWSDLLISRSERDKFEVAHSLRLGPPWHSRTWAWLGDQVNQRVLTMLSGWLVVLTGGLWALWLHWQQAQFMPTAAPNASMDAPASGKTIGSASKATQQLASETKALPASAPQLKR